MREPRREASADLYEVLEVSPRASHDVIHAAYRVLARNAHPDVNSASDAEHRIRQLNAAYEVLSDPAHRARYDLEIARARRRERLSMHAESVLSQPAPRPRALHVREVPRSRRTEDRFPILSLQAVMLLVAVAAFATVLLAAVWMGLETVTADEKVVRFDAPPAYTRPVMPDR